MFLLYLGRSLPSLRPSLKETCTHWPTDPEGRRVWILVCEYLFLPKPMIISSPEWREGSERPLAVESGVCVVARLPLTAAQIKFKSPRP